jgi:alcohol dehydrogenase class IV
MTTPFRAVAYPARVFSGPRAIEHLSAECRRLDASRAFVVSGRSLAADEAQRGRVEAALGETLVGWYGRVDKDSSFVSVSEATEQAREAGADLLVALGGGSAIVAARGVAIFLAESGDPFELMTQYPEGQAAVSPRLDAAKPPIINIPTTPNTAVNRAGSALKNDDLDHRMEYFDPKTRPASIIWDDELLMATPVEVFRSTATTVFSGAVTAAGTSTDPLADGDRAQALRLARAAYPRIGTVEDGPGPRIDLMAVAFLQNRAGDVTLLERRNRPRGWGHSYALGTALHLRYEQVGQGETASTVNPAALELDPPDRDALQRIGEAIGLELGADSDDAQAAKAIADALRSIYRAAGMPTRLRDLGVPADEFEAVIAATGKNFNANPGLRDGDPTGEMRRILEAAW